MKLSFFLALLASSCIVTQAADRGHHHSKGHKVLRAEGGQQHTKKIWDETVCFGYSGDIGICVSGDDASACTGGTTYDNACFDLVNTLCCVTDTVPDIPLAAPADAPAPNTDYLPPAPTASDKECKSPINGFTGSCIAINDCTGATFNNLCKGGSEKCCVPETRSVTTTTTFALTDADFQSLFPAIRGARATAFRFYFNAAASKLLDDNPDETTKCYRLAAFIAQVSHESGGLRYFEELASGEEYEDRKDLGNTEEGDGKKFKGRGPIQLTGRSNYDACGTALGQNLIDQPELACFPSLGFDTTVWYWKSKNLNSVATSSEDDFVRLTKKINGGTNGLDDRKSRWTAAKTKLGCK